MVWQGPRNTLYSEGDWYECRKLGVRACYPRKFWHDFESAKSGWKNHRLPKLISRVSWHSIPGGLRHNDTFPPQSRTYFLSAVAISALSACFPPPPPPPKKKKKKKNEKNLDIPVKSELRDRTKSPIQIFIKSNGHHYDVTRWVSPRLISLGCLWKNAVEIMQMVFSWAVKIKGLLEHVIVIIAGHL